MYSGALHPGRGGALWRLPIGAVCGALAGLILADFGSMVHPVRVHYTSILQQATLPTFWYMFGMGILPLVNYGSSCFTQVTVCARWVPLRELLWISIFRSLCPTPPLFINWAAIGTHSNSIEDFRNIRTMIYIYNMHTHFLVIFSSAYAPTSLGFQHIHGKTMENCCKSKPRIMRTSHSSNTFHSRCSSSKTTLLRNMLVECWRHGGLGSLDGGCRSGRIEIDCFVGLVELGILRELNLSQMLEHENMLDSRNPSNTLTPILPIFFHFQHLSASSYCPCRWLMTLVVRKPAPVHRDFSAQRVERIKEIGEILLMSSPFRRSIMRESTAPTIC